MGVIIAAGLAGARGSSTRYEHLFRGFVRGGGGGGRGLSNVSSASNDRFLRDRGSSRGFELELSTFFNWARCVGGGEKLAV